MSNPNLLAPTSVTQDILAEAQLSSGNNDYTVPTGKSWTVRSIAMCNTSGSSVTLNVYAIKTGGTARQLVKSRALAAGDSLILGADLISMLPEAATLRVNASAGTAVDLFVTGVVSA